MFEEIYKAEIDSLYPRAVALLPQYKESGILITDLQRRFLTGHTICALVMERLEKNGLVSGYNGATPRKVYLENGVNTWGLQFTKVENVGFKILLGLNIGDEMKTRALFNKLKDEYVENNSDPDCLIDLLDENDSIVEDISLSKDQVIEIASRLGHDISEKVKS